MPCLIRPHLFKQLGNIEEASGFFLVVDRQYKGMFEIDEVLNNYSCYKIIYSNDVELKSIISQIPPFAHVLIISPRFSSTLSSGQRKILCLGTTSTNLSFDDIVNIINIMEITNMTIQEAWIENFLSSFSEDKKLHIIDPYFNTEASFTLSKGNEVGIMAGLMDWGDSWACVSGECGFFPDNNINEPQNINLLLNGEIILSGACVVSRLKEVEQSEQEKIFDDLNTIKDGNIILNIHQGKIKEIVSSDDCSRRAANRIEQLLNQNGNYSVIIEIAFGINTSMQLLLGNKLINEMYGGNNGCFHIGIGHQSWSEYHIDFICPRSKCYIGTKLIAG